MAISSIQPIMAFNISGFSAVMQATATSPPQLLSVTTQTVTTPVSSTIVTIGTTQPLSQPLFNASGLLVPTTGTSTASLLGLLGNTTGSALDRSLAADVQIAVAGLDLSGPRTIGTVDLLNPNAAPTGATTVAVTGTTAAPAASLPNEAAQGAAAANTAAISGTAAGATITATATLGTPATTTATPAGATTGATVTTTAPGAAVATGTAVVPGSDAAAVLQRLVTDATTRAISNIRDPAFAATSAALFVSAAVFRSLNDTGMVTGVGTADTAGAPPPEVTPPRPVLPV